MTSDRSKLNMFNLERLHAQEHQRQNRYPLQHATIPTRKPTTRTTIPITAATNNDVTHSIYDTRKSQQVQPDSSNMAPGIRKRKDRAELIRLSLKQRRERHLPQYQYYLMLDISSQAVRRLRVHQKATHFQWKYIPEEDVEDYDMEGPPLGLVEARNARRILAQGLLKKSWLLMRSKLRMQRKQERTSQYTQAQSSSFPNLKKRDGRSPVPPRYCPAILPTEQFSKRPSVNHNGVSIDFQLQVYQQSPEEREELTSKNKDYLIQRSASDKWLTANGRRPINNEAVGRAPPISKARLIEIARVAVEKKLEEELRGKMYNSLPPPTVKNRSNSLPWEQHFLAGRAKPPTTEKRIEELNKPSLLRPTQCSGQEHEDTQKRPPASIICTQWPISGSSEGSLSIRRGTIGVADGSARGFRAHKAVKCGTKVTAAESFQALALVSDLVTKEILGVNEEANLGEGTQEFQKVDQVKKAVVPFKGVQSDRTADSDEALAPAEVLRILCYQLESFADRVKKVSEEGEGLAIFKFKPERAAVHGMPISDERLESCVESFGQGSQRDRFRSLISQVPVLPRGQTVLPGVGPPAGALEVTGRKPATVGPELEAGLFRENSQLVGNEGRGLRAKAQSSKGKDEAADVNVIKKDELGGEVQELLGAPANGDGSNPSPVNGIYTFPWTPGYRHDSTPNWLPGTSAEWQLQLINARHVTQKHRGFGPSTLSVKALSSPLEQDQPTRAALDPTFHSYLRDMEASRLSVRPQAVSAMVEDARQMQKQVFEDCRKAGKDPPKYTLLQLIGKGAFGRVYKGKDMQTAAVVAVKIIDIDESDTINPRLADAYGDFIKEVNALTALSEINARNINNVTEALPVGKSMWMITEYCAGGSVSTLMSPTRPGGLQEKWIIPILREVAEAIRWVHSVKIIHRDIKCGNVLITEKGEVQLCDFGIASMLETKIDKRKTVIGTPNWMAPELFDDQVTYGQDIDIWAFGAMAYEIATGSPPNAGKSLDQIGRILKQAAPRLESDSYSEGLRSLIAYCLEPIPDKRPSIEDVEKHHYIFNTTTTHPTSSLTQLVKAYKMWEDHGGSRRSLFIPGGAAGPSEAINEAAIEEWNFSTTVAFEQEVGRSENPQDVFDAYGTGVELDTNFIQSRPNPYKGRRRPPPQSLPQWRHPIEVLFDPNTISNYKDNSVQQYGTGLSSDLPLRDDSSASIVDTMIDLGGHDPQTGMSSFPDLDTIKAGRRGRDEIIEEYSTTSQDFSRPALSDPEPLNNNRRTQDWKFPSMAPPASADPEISRFPTTYETARPSVTPGSGGRPALVHHPTEPLGGAFGGLSASTNAIDRMSMSSLIDLDFSVPQPVDYGARPSTANSDVGSVTSERTSTRNPFEFERHASRVLPQFDGADDQMEPEIYITEEVSLPLRQRHDNSSRDLGEVSDFSASDVDSSQRNSESRYFSETSDSDYISMPPPPRPNGHTQLVQNSLPQPPSAAALSGEASDSEMSSEFHRMIDGLTDQLQIFRQSYEGLKPTTVTRRPSQRRENDGATAT